MRTAILVSVIAVACGSAAFRHSGADESAAVRGASNPLIDVTAADIRSAVHTRGDFVPADHLVIDECSLLNVVNSDVVAELSRTLQAGTIVSCNQPRPDGSTLWKLAGAMQWYGGSGTALAVDVEYGRRMHRELYILEQGRVLEISLRTFGYLD